MGMSGMNSPEQTLKELLARLLSVAPSPADSVLRLLAYARLYAAVSRLQAAGAAGRVCPDRRAHDLRAASLVRVLRERLSRSGLPLVDKARLAAAYHDLRSEAFPFRSSGSDEVFPEAVSSLMDRYSSAAEDGVLAEATPLFLSVPRRPFRRRRPSGLRTLRLAFRLSCASWRRRRAALPVPLPGSPPAGQRLSARCRLGRSSGRSLQRPLPPLCPAGR